MPAVGVLSGRNVNSLENNIMTVNNPLSSDPSETVIVCGVDQAVLEKCLNSLSGLYLAVAFNIVSRWRCVSSMEIGLVWAGGWKGNNTF